jgi:Domain of unknown function (DUF4249)
MKHTFLKISFLMASLFSFNACTKIIEVDLNSVDPQFVIEGEISNQTGAYTVKISKTVNVTDGNIYPAVKGAIVTINDNVGNKEILTETQSGTYTTKKLQGVVGRTYTLTVVAEGKTFTAQSTMPSLVPLQGVFAIKSGGFPPGSGDSYVLYPKFQDPANIINKYRFVVTINGKKEKELIVQNDNSVDGLPNNRPVFSRNLKVELGDTVNVALQSLDLPVYDYFYGLSQLAGGGPGGGSTPANPVTNIKGGAAGYFSAYSVDDKTVIVK